MEILSTNQCYEAQIYSFIHLFNEHFLSFFYVLEPKDNIISAWSFSLRSSLRWESSKHIGNSVTVVCRGCCGSKAGGSRSFLIGSEGPRRSNVSKVKTEWGLAKTKEKVGSRTRQQHKQRARGEKVVCF